MRTPSLTTLAVFLLTVLLLSGAVTPVFAAEDAAHIAQHDIHVRFDPSGHRLVARDVMQVHGGPQGGILGLRLAKTLAISRFEVAGKQHPVLRDEETGELGLSVPAGGPHTVTLSYAGTIYDAVEKADDLSWVVGDNTRGVIAEVGVYLSDASGWVPLPMVRAPASFNLTTYVPKPFLVVTQGGPIARTELQTKGFDASSNQLVPSTQKSGDDVTWEVATHPATIATDGLSLSAGPYVQTSRDVEGVKLSTFFYPKHQRHANLWLDAGAETIERYAKLLGSYPHTKFDIVENFFQSGYGMPSYTLLGDRVIDYVTAKARRHGGKIPPGYLDHEYVHGWFGNGLFVDYDTGNWCEALTTYYSNYLARELDNATEARAYRRGVLEKFAMRVHGKADYPLRKFVTKTEDADNDVGYGKGAMFFHQVRTRMGDKAFFDRVKAFTTAHMGTIVSWDQWLDALDQDGSRALLAPYLERAGVPQLSIAAVDTSTTDDKRTRAKITVSNRGPDGTSWPARVAVRLRLLDAEGTHRLQTHHVEVMDQDAVLDVVVDGTLAVVELDPNYDILRRIPTDELPHCLNRTLETKGNGIVYVDAPEGADSVRRLADRLCSNKGFTLAPADFDAASHDGPVITLRVLASMPEEGFVIAGETIRDATVSIARSYDTKNGPRTEYIAMSPDAAKRAGYMPYYGWDTFVKFHNGIPRERRMVRADATSTRKVLVEAPDAAAKRAAGWIHALSATSRAPGQRQAVVETQLLVALGGLTTPKVETDVRFISNTKVTNATLEYVVGSHQGKLEGNGIRPFSFSGSGTTAWLPRAQFRVISYDNRSTPAKLYEQILADGATSQGVIVVADKAGWTALSPWLDTLDRLSEASKADLAKPGRDGQPRPAPASKKAWMSGRRARLGLPSPEPLKIPVLCVRADMLPKRAAADHSPLGAVEELSLDVAIQHEWTKGRNLVAWKPASSAPPASAGLKPPVVLVMAHYDTLPWREGHTYAGADDNASGVACVLEVARAVAKMPANEHVGVVFALTDAEESGLYGARALQTALAKAFEVRAVINVDSVGRAVSKTFHLIGQSIHPQIAGPVAEALATEGIELGTDIDRYAYAHGSDHYPFHQAGIPAVSLWASDYGVMNTTRDTPDLVESEGIARIARAIITLLSNDLSWVMAMR